MRFFADADIASALPWDGLVAAIERGVNEHETGPVVEFGLRHPAVRGVMFQPVTHTGRHPDHDPMVMVTFPSIKDSEGAEGVDNNAAVLHPISRYVGQLEEIERSGNRILYGPFTVTVDGAGIDFSSDRSATRSGFTRHTMYTDGGSALTMKFMSGCSRPSATRIAARLT